MDTKPLQQDVGQSQGAEERKLPRLEELLEYKNQNVVDAFCEVLDVPSDMASAIFSDMLRFLWLGQYASRSEPEGSKSVGTIDHPILIIDEMWHIFILFTRDYSLFCRQYFGCFIGHQPTTVTEKVHYKRMMCSPEFRSKAHATHRHRYEKTLEVLGRDVFARWYIEYPKAFPPDRIRQIRRK